MYIHVYSCSVCYQCYIFTIKHGFTTATLSSLSISGGAKNEPLATHLHTPNAQNAKAQSRGLAATRLPNKCAFRSLALPVLPAR